MSKNRKAQKPKYTLSGTAIFFIAVMALLVGLSYIQTSTEFVAEPSKPSQDTKPIKALINSGPFGIDKTQIQIGESLRFFVDGLSPNEKGKAVVITPSEHEFISINFDGTKKTSFMRTLTPASDFCYDCVGTWQIEFRTEDGTKYEPLTFEVVIN